MHSSAGHAAGSSLVMLKEGSAPCTPSKLGLGAHCQCAHSQPVQGMHLPQRTVPLASPLKALALASDSRSPTPLNAFFTSAQQPRYGHHGNAPQNPGHMYMRCDWEHVEASG